MKDAILLGLTLLLVACGQGPETEARKVGDEQPDPGKEKRAVEDLIQRLPYVQLPWSCELWKDQFSVIQLTGQELEQLANDPQQEAGVAVGRLYDPSGAKHILWLSPADVDLPMLTTFSSEGEFIHVEGLVIGECGPGPCYECKETVRIDLDFTILTTDTITACECDSTFEPLSKPCEHYVMIREGSLSANGAFMAPKKRIELN